MSKPVSDLAWSSSSALPLPTYQLGSTWRRFCHSAPTTSAPAVVGERGELGEAVLGGPAGVVAGVDGDEEGLLDGRGEVDRSSCGAWDPAYRAPYGVSGRVPSTRVARNASRRSRAAAPRPPVASMTARPGSRRNQVRLALRELVVVERVELDRRLPGQLAVEVRPALAVADGGERPEGRIPALAQGPRLLDQAGVELGAGPFGDPPTVLRAVDDELEAEQGRRVADGRRQRRVAAQLGDLEGAGRRGAGCAGRSGAARVGASRAAGRRAPRRRRAPARRRARARSVRVRRERVRVDPGRDRPQPEPGAAGEDADRRPAAPSASSASSACARKSATEYGWSGSTRSRPWWTTRARSAGVAFAVPMSRPR